jgi:hypothetical protein
VGVNVLEHAAVDGGAHGGGHDYEGPQLPQLFAVQRSSSNCSTVTPASFRIWRRVPGRTCL